MMPIGVANTRAKPTIITEPTIAWSTPPPVEVAPNVTGLNVLVRKSTLIDPIPCCATYAMMRISGISAAAVATTVRTSMSRLIMTRLR